MSTRNLILASGLGLVLAGSLVGAMVQDREVDRDKDALLKAAKTQDRTRDLLPGQEPRPQWEYKVIELNFTLKVADYEKQFNELGKEGWEYAGAFGFKEPPEKAVFKKVVKK